ncbi:MAG: nodulation protein NfeD, partial [Acidobacteria bacterium]|nr:nodulation protein NfeD [Acidobacteriota bacterium]
MRKVCGSIISCLVLAVLATTSLAEAAGVVRVHRIEGGIYGVTASSLERALAEAESEGAVLFVLELDTPGGLVTAAEDMISAILNSEVPVAAFVTPKGAHAASAGFFLLIASDVAAMSPVTRTGSAHPVTIGGENSAQDIGLKKLAEDLAALIRSAAAARGRPAELAEKAVSEAKSWSAEEAVQAGLVDVIADDLDELIDLLDGREIVRSDGTRQTLSLKGAVVVRHEPTALENIEEFLFHPVTMGLLLVLAGLGFYIEFNNPGMIVPGVVGALCLLVFLYGSQVLPVNLVGIALVALGIVLFVLEIKIVSYGLLTLAGGVSVAAGLYLLFDRAVPGTGVSLAAIAAIAVAAMAAAGAVTWMVVRAQRQKPTTGREG